LYFNCVKLCNSGAFDYTFVGSGEAKEDIPNEQLHESLA